MITYLAYSDGMMKMNKLERDCLRLISIIGSKALHIFTDARDANRYYNGSYHNCEFLQEDYERLKAAKDAICKLKVPNLEEMVKRRVK